MAGITEKERERRARARAQAKTDEMEARVLARAACYANESDLKNLQTRHDLCLQAAGLHEHYWLVLMRSLTGKGRAEETRTLPAIASNYARIMDKIGVTAERLQPEEEEL